MQSKTSNSAHQIALIELFINFAKFEFDILTLSFWGWKYYFGWSTSAFKHFLLIPFCWHLRCFKEAFCLHWAFHARNQRKCRQRNWIWSLDTLQLLPRICSNGLCDVSEEFPFELQFFGCHVWYGGLNLVIHCVVELYPVLCNKYVFDVILNKFGL